MRTASRAVTSIAKGGNAGAARPVPLLAMVLVLLAAEPLPAQVPVPPLPQLPQLPPREILDPAGRAEPLADRSDLFAPPVPASCPFANSPLVFRLDAVVFEGRRPDSDPRAEARLEAALAATHAEFVGREVPLATLCTIRDRAAAALFDQGRLARVEIPEQRIADGRVRLEVIDARVETVRVIGVAGPVAHKVERYAAQIRGMNPFDLRRAQRALLLASDLPGVQLRTIIRPGASGRRGAIDIELLVERDPVRATANLQNLQSRQTGRWALLGRVDANGMTSLGERTTLAIFRTIPDNEQFVIQAREELRIGGNGLRLSAGLSYGETRPGDVLRPLDLRATSVVGTVELAWPAVKRRMAEAELAGGLDIVSQRTSGPGFGLVVEDQLRVFYARASAARRFRLGGAGGRARLGQLAGEVQLRQGLPGIGASDPGDPLLSRLDGRADAFVARFEASASLPLAERASLGLRGRGQLASKPLLAYEELTIGNLTVGRGYDPATVAGDEGAAGSVELRFGPFALPVRSVASPYVFFDAGHVSNRDRNGFAETLASAGAGVTWQLPGRFAVDLAWARPLDGALGNPRPPDRLLVQATVGF